MLGQRRSRCRPPSARAGRSCAAVRHRPGRRWRWSRASGDAAPGRSRPADAPARSMSVAAVWRSRCGRTTPSPARRAAASDDGRHPATRVKPTMRRLHPQEHLPRRGRTRATAAQVRGDRLADIHGQRQLVDAAALAVDRELPGPPVHVIQPQRRDLVGPQPEPQASARSPRSHVDRWHGADHRRAATSWLLRRCDALGQQRPPPPRHRQRRPRQVALDQPGEDSSSAGTSAARTRSAAPTPATTSGDLVRAPRATRPPRSARSARCHRGPARNLRTSATYRLDGQRRHAPLTAQVAGEPVHQSIRLGPSARTRIWTCASSFTRHR